MAEVYFAPSGLRISRTGIRVILELLPPVSAAELREELARPVPERVAIDNIFRRVQG